MADYSKDSGAKCVGVQIPFNQQSGFRMDSRKPGSAGSSVSVGINLESKGVTKGGDVQRPAGYGPEKSQSY